MADRQGTPPATDIAPRGPADIAPLGVEEYIEQAHFFAALADRFGESTPTQEVLQSVREEALATTKLPMAIDFMLTELRHAGVLATAMARLPHYFTGFQTFVMGEAENEQGKFEFRLGLNVLAREAEYRAGRHESAELAGTVRSVPGLFLYQFEVLCRNRLGYDRGLAAIAQDPAFDPAWRKWIDSLRRQIGMVDLADLIYVHSEHYRRRAASDENLTLLFGEQEGRIALANRKKDPLFLFASLHRQLGYPSPPRPDSGDGKVDPVPQLLRRLEQLEKKVQLLEDDNRGGFDLTKFYAKPGQPPEPTLPD